MKTLTNPIFKICLIVAIAAGVGFSQTWTTPSLKDFKSHSLKGDNFTEAWNYSLYFDNGTKAYVTYSLNNLPMKGKVFGGELSLQNYKGKNKSVSREYPYKRFAWKNEIQGMELTGNETRMAIEGKPGKGHRVQFKTNKNGGYTLDVNFTSAYKGGILGNGEQEVKGAKFGQVFHIPEGRVKGIIVVGKDTLEVSGYGVLEHSWQNRLVSDLFAHAVQFFKPGTHSGKAFVTEEDYGQIVRGTVAYKTANGYKFELVNKYLSKGRTMKAHSNLPKETTLKSDSYSVDFTRKKDKQVYSPLDNIDGWLARKAVKVALGEVKVRRGTAQGTHYSMMEK
jgi:hypothetical protein